MRKRIVICLERAQAYEASWVVNDGHEEGPSMIKNGPLAEAAAAAVGARVVVLVPTEEVLLASVAIPATQRRRLLSAVPYALEDQLADDVETLHFAVGGRDPQGNVATAVVAKKIMSGWIEQLATAGIQPSVVLPDVLAVPVVEGRWSLLLDGKRALLRTGPQAGIALERDNLEAVVTMALAAAAEESRPTRLVVYDTDPEPDLQTLADLGLELEAVSCDGPAIVLLAQHVDERSGIDLLQAEYSRREQLGKLWRPWLPAAGLLVTWVLVEMAGAGVEYMRLSADLAALQQQAANIYLQTFPDAKLRGDPRAQMESRLRELKGGGAADGSGFLELLADVGDDFQAASSLQIDRVNYRAGEINVAFTIGDLQTLDQLKQKLAEDGKLKVEIQSATSRDDKVEARLQIGKAGT